MADKCDFRYDESASGHGYTPGRGFVVFFPDGSHKSFCDSECLRRWFERAQERFEARMREEMRQLARDVNGEE